MHLYDLRLVPFLFNHLQIFLSHHRVSMKAAPTDDFTAISRRLKILPMNERDDWSQLLQFSKGKRCRSGTHLVHM